MTESNMPGKARVKSPDAEKGKQLFTGASNAFQSEAVTIRWQNINVVAYPPGYGKALFAKRQAQQLLRNMTGVANSGEFLAIMGPSGAGKTSLLNVLTYHNTKTLEISGNIYVNDEPIFLPTFPNIMAYVYQEDLFVGHLTVKEQLMFKAYVSLDKSLSINEKKLIVKQCLLELGLVDCRNTFIGTPGGIKGISGGEKKRLSLAGEILNNPSLIICDEPTSGLDSYMATNIVQVLKRLTQKGKTVICTIHSPSSDCFELFDKILLITQGRVAFLGPTALAMKFFSGLVGACPANFNHADYLVMNIAIDPSNEVDSRALANIICDRFEETQPKAKPMAGPSRLKEFKKCHKPSPANVCYGVLFRAWINFMRNPQMIRVTFGQTAVVATLLVSVYYNTIVKTQNDVNNITSSMAIVMFNLCFQCMLTVINTFTGEIPVIERERKKKLYGISHYLLARMFVELPLYILNALFLASVTYTMIGLNPDPNRYHLALLVHVLAANVAVSFGYMIAAICNNLSVALAVGPPLLMPFILFGGYFITLDSVPSYYSWLPEISWFRHTMEALMAIQWHDYVAPEWNDGGSPAIGGRILQFFQFKYENLEHCIYALIGSNIFYRLVAYIVLVIKTIGD